MWHGWTRLNLFWLYLLVKGMIIFYISSMLLYYYLLLLRMLLACNFLRNINRRATIITSCAGHAKTISVRYAARPWGGARSTLGPTDASNTLQTPSKMVFCIIFSYQNTNLKWLQEHLLPFSHRWLLSNCLSSNENCKFIWYSGRRNTILGRDIYPYLGARLVAAMLYTSI